MAAGAGLGARSEIIQLVTPVFFQRQESAQTQGSVCWCGGLGVLCQLVQDWTGLFFFSREELSSLFFSFTAHFAEPSKNFSSGKV